MSWIRRSFWRVVAVARALFVFSLLMVLRTVSRVFFRHVVWWAGEPLQSWRDVRVVAALNHTSLYEPLYAGALPPALLWRIARWGLVPVADKTLRRPLVGLFFKMVAQRVVVVTRQQDETWQRVLGHVGGDSIVVLFPEGRMKRADGLDSEGKPMTVRGGIADILAAVPTGRLVLGYCGGLHHIQVPGQLLPKPFKTIRLGLEAVDIPSYRQSLFANAGEASLKRLVIEDLQSRRDRYCPTGGETDASSEIVPLPFPGSEQTAQDDDLEPARRASA